MEDRQCAECGAWFTPPEEAIYWRYCSTDCWRVAEDRREQELIQRGMRLGGANGQRASQAELDAARAEGYRRGHVDGVQEGWRHAKADVDERVRAAVDLLAPLVPQSVPDDDPPPW